MRSLFNQDEAVKEQSRPQAPSMDSEELLQAISELLSKALTSSLPEAVHTKLIEILATLTKSQFAFIGEARRHKTGQIETTICGTTTKRIQEASGDSHFEFKRCFDPCLENQSIVRQACLTGVPMIHNELGADDLVADHQLGFPAGKSFIGIPIYYGAEMIGILGAMNSSLPYSHDLLRVLQPLVNASAHVLVGQQHSRALAHLDQAKRLANAIQSSQIEQSQEGILVVTQDGKIYSCNEVFRQQWGVTRDEAESWQLPNLISFLCRFVRSPDELRSLLVETLHINNECLTSRIECMDGRTFQIHSGPIIDEFQTHYGRTWYFRDLTVQIRNELELSDARARAETANRAKTEFLSNMSHEIRNPLAAILGYGETLHQESENPEHLKLLESVQNNGQYLLQLIDDILDVTKLDSMTVQAQCTQFSVRELLEESLALLQFRATEQRNRLELWIDDSVPPQILTDRIRLRQILINLITNAIKFTEAGVIQVRVWTPSDAGHACDKLNFQVSDTGIGMSAEQIDKIFRMFNQADSSVARKQGGVGLGLALCKRLTMLLGGDISVASKPNVGSRFSFSIRLASKPTLPGTDQQQEEPFDSNMENPSSGNDATDQPNTNPILSRIQNLEHEIQHEMQHDTQYAIRQGGQQGQLDSDAQISPTCLSGIRILVVDDAPDIRRILVEKLTAQGAVTRTASNWSSALGQALEHGTDAGRFDVILLDTQMPEVDGFMAATRLRHLRFSRPLIAISSGTLETDSERARKSGFDSCLSKPQLVSTDRGFASLVSTIQKLSQSTAASIK